MFNHQPSLSNSIHVRFQYTIDQSLVTCIVTVFTVLRGEVERRLIGASRKIDSEGSAELGACIPELLEYPPFGTADARSMYFIGEERSLLSE